MDTLGIARSSSESAPTSPAASGKQVCAECASSNGKAVTLTSLVVYIRCNDCGNVWSIQQRRKDLRPDDPRKF